MALALWYFWPGTAVGPGGPGGRGFRTNGQATPVSVAQAATGRIDRTLRALGTVTPLAFNLSKAVLFDPATEKRIL